MVSITEIHFNMTANHARYRPIQGASSEKNETGELNRLFYQRRAF